MLPNSTVHAYGLLGANVETDVLGGPPPVIVVYKEYKRTLIQSLLSPIMTITGWGLHLTDVSQLAFQNALNKQ